MQAAIAAWVVRVFMSSAASAPKTLRRARVLMSGTLFTHDGARKVIIRDLSNVGALVSADTKIPCDCDAIFKKGSVFAAARVAWSDGVKAGLFFYRELSDEDLLPSVRISV